VTTYLLQENGDDLLLENGDRIVLDELLLSGESVLSASAAEISLSATSATISIGVTP